MADHGEGIFTMEFVNSVAGLDLEVAQSKAHEWVDLSTALPKNKLKAHAMIDFNNDPRAKRSTYRLTLGMTNFMLSHMGMKVIK